MRFAHPLQAEAVFIVLTNHPEAPYRKLYLEAGASYFLDKTTEFERVRELVAKLGTAH